MSRFSAQEHRRVLGEVGMPVHTHVQSTTSVTSRDSSGHLPKKDAMPSLLKRAHDNIGVETTQNLDLERFVLKKRPPPTCKSPTPP